MKASQQQVDLSSVVHHRMVTISSTWSHEERLRRARRAYLRQQELLESMLRCCGILPTTRDQLTHFAATLEPQ